MDADRLVPGQGTEEDPEGTDRAVVHVPGYLMKYKRLLNYPVYSTLNSLEKIDRSVRDFTSLCSAPYKLIANKP